MIAPKKRSFFIHPALSLIITLTLWIQTTCSHAEPGRTSAQFLARDAGTRALALGGAVTALWGDVESLAYNPAGIGTIEGPQINLMYSQGIARDGFGFAGAALPAWGQLYGGLGAINYDSGSIDLNLSNGVKDTRKAQQDFAAIAAAALKPWPFLSVGGSIKSFRSSLAQEYKASGEALDGGVIWKIPSSQTKMGEISLGAAIVNAGEDITYHQVRDPIPTKTSLGLTWRFYPATEGYQQKVPAGWEILFLSDVSQTKHEESVVSLGFELTQYRLLESDSLASIRLGYKNYKEYPTTHAGFFWGYRSHGINYAIVIHKSGLLQHQFALTIKL